jgi:hypothetical protein
MAVPAQELLQAPLQQWRHVAAGEAVRQHRRGRPPQRGGGHRISTDPGRQRPQLQIHLGGDIVRQPAQHLVQLARLDVVAGELASEGPREEPGTGDRHDRRHDRHNRAGEQPLRMIQPLRGGHARRHGEPRTRPPADLVNAPPCRSRPEQPLGDLQRDLEAHGHRKEPPDERPPRRGPLREPGVVA